MNSCVLTCVKKPDQAQQQRLLTFLKEKHGAAAEELPGLGGHQIGRARVRTAVT